MDISRQHQGWSLQQRAEHADNRQQQQDNGTREFQPPRQQGDDVGGDARCTLDAYLRRAQQAGDLPRPRPAGDSPALPKRPGLRLAK